jgi:N-acetylglucosamine kinase-like BadF-type ATPase
MSQRYYLGFDGGGTKTRACVLDEDGVFVGESFGPASSIDTVSLATSLESLERTFSSLPFRPLPAAVFLGLGGIAGRRHATLYEEAARSLSFVRPETFVRVESDVVNALASGTGKLEGMALIVGTGSVCFGMKDGRSWRAGGYHYKEGDAGSGYDLGFMALKHYARVLDRRRPATSFSQAIGESLGIYEFPDLVDYFERLTRTGVAGLAPIVTGHASSDPFAKAIVDAAAAEIGLLVATVYRELGFTNCELTIVGGLGNAETVYRTAILEHIVAVSPDIRVVRPLFDPAHAAAEIARTTLRRVPASGR